MSVHTVTSPEHFKTLLSADLQRVSLINFWAPWADPCTSMNQVVKGLAEKYPEILTLQVEAEEQSDIADSFEIEAVPSFVILRGHTLLAKVNGADAKALTAAVATHARPIPSINPRSSTAQSPAAPVEENALELQARLKALINQDKIMLFIKGTPEAPRCGFSRKIVGILNEQKVKYSTFDILTDESVRAGLKVYNEWPTFPQLIINGQFVGGLDIVEELVKDGEFQELVESTL